MPDKPIDMAKVFEEKGDHRPEVLELFKNMKDKLPELEKFLEEMNDHWHYEDGVYRMYHQSFKVYYLQPLVKKAVELLTSLASKEHRPKRFALKGEPREYGPLNDYFMKIVGDGTAKEFDMSDNKRWLEATRPIVEAFFHTKFMVEMIVKYVKEFKDEEAPPNWLPSGWAAVLYLYNLR